MDRFKMDYFIAMIPKVIKLLPATVKAALLSLLLSLLLGLVLAVVRQYKIKGLYALSSIYLSFFRGTPFIAQLYLFYYGLATISTTIKDMSAFGAIVICLSANYCAFMSEDIRAALNSVSKDKYQAGLSIGMKQLALITNIRLTTATRIAIPGLSNNFINLFKSTSIGFMIGFKDMMAVVSMETSRTYRFLEGYLVATVIYWAIISVLNVIQSHLE